MRLVMPEFFQNPPVLSALIGFIAGAALAVLFLMTRISSLKSTLTEREKSTNRIIAKLEADEASSKSEIAQLRNSEATLFKSQSELETRLEIQRQRNQDTLQLLNTVEERFTNTFRDLSHDALKLSQQQFLQLAESTLQNAQKEARDEFEKREQAAAQLMKSVAESLETMQSRTGEIEKGREGDNRDALESEDIAFKANSAANDFRAALDDEI